MPPFPLSPNTRAQLKRRLRRIVELGQRAGIDVLPRHYYSQIPDLHELRRETDWRRPLSMDSVRGVAIDEQLDFLRRVCPPELASELRDLRILEHASASNGEPGYGPIEADLLHCFVRSLRPRKVIQVGAGVSTAVIDRAGVMEGLDLAIVCVEPYPTDYLTGLASGGRIELVRERAQLVDAALLADLDAGDLLFIDSTHTVKPGSEVNRLILDVMPRLRKGVFVHFHDILFPYDYSPAILDDDMFFWSESVLLHAYLADNRRVRVRCSMSMLHDEVPAAVADILPRYVPASHAQGLSLDRALGTHFPSSTYLEVDE